MAGFANGVNDVGLVPAYVSMEKLATSMFPTLIRELAAFLIDYDPSNIFILSGQQKQKNCKRNESIEGFCPFIDRHM